MKIKTHIWEDTAFPEFDDNLVMHFKTPTWDATQDYKISIDVFWKNNKLEVYLLEDIYITRPFKIVYTFQNGITIKGTLEIKKFNDFNSKDSLGVFADFYYFNCNHSTYIWHTEGFLISFNPINEVIIEEEVEPAVNPTIKSNSFNDLFPYIYLSGWPKINSSEQLLNFFYYTPYNTSPPSTSFLNKLASLKLSKDRKQIQLEAITFIEKKSPYQLQYVSNVDSLQGYIGSFKAFYNILSKEKTITEIMSQICIFFNTDIDHIITYLGSTTYLINKQRLWESYCALIIEVGYANENLKAIIEVLTLCNFLEKVAMRLHIEKDKTTLDANQLLSLFNATIILDDTIFPLPPYTSSPPVAPTNPIVPYAIGNLQLVKYKLSRYEAGELASITSIMPGEKRKLINRKLDRIIDKEISDTTYTNDTTTTTNENSSNFNEELWNAIAETTETTNYPGDGLVSSYGPPTNITVKGEYTKQYTTQTPDKKQLSSFAKKVLNKTTQRLSEKVNRVRAYTELKESENTSVSLMNNSSNKEPVYGMHCWLNKVYQTEVINYGNRMLFSFIIPNPAQDYIDQTKILNGTNFQEPKSLEDFGINMYQDLTDTNYLSISQYYDLKKFPLYPQEKIVVSDVVTVSQSKLIALPDLYIASNATVEYAFGSGAENTIVSGFLGENTFTLKQSEGLTGNKVFTTLNNEQSKIATSAVYTPSIHMSPPNSEIDFQMGVNITCTPLPQTILRWQIETYQLLLEAYQKKMLSYNDQIGSINTKKEDKNPLTERLTVKIELEKNIRKQLLQNAKEIKGISSINNLNNATIAYNQPEIIQYLNSSLEWNEISYTFFDKYDTGNDMFSVSSLSPDFFSAFLKAAYARVTIPIEPSFNYGFLYFLNTGDIWFIKDSFTPCFKDVNTNETINSDQLSIVYKLKKTLDDDTSSTKIIDSWEVLIPTSMQILQNKKHIKIDNYE